MKSMIIQCKKIINRQQHLAGFKDNIRNQILHTNYTIKTDQKVITAIFSPKTSAINNMNKNFKKENQMFLKK